MNSKTKKPKPKTPFELLQENFLKIIQEKRLKSDDVTLANKLGVSDRSIRSWASGKGKPSLCTMTGCIQILDHEPLTNE